MEVYVNWKIAKKKLVNKPPKVFYLNSDQRTVRNVS